MVPVGDGGQRLGELGAGIEGMFRATGRDRSTPRPAGFEVTPDPEVSARYGNIIVGPPR